LLATTTDAFVPLTKLTTTTTTTTRLLATTLEEDLARLQSEYKHLQERLLDDVVRKHDEADAELVEQQLLEIATEATRLQEMKQVELMEEAEHLKHDAQVARDRAMQLKQQECKEVDARLVDEIKLAYEDLVRYSDYKELQAQTQLEAAQTLLAELFENERRLQATLETLKHAHDHEMKEELHTRHRSFLDNVKGAILSHPDIMINLDPHIL